jgi:hypothetical protein
MNQGKMRNFTTYSFSNIQNSLQGATQVQMSKLDTLQVRNDLNYMITKFHNFSLVGIMQRFSTQSKSISAHMTWEHIFQAFFISFSDL